MMMITVNNIRLIPLEKLITENAVAARKIAKILRNNNAFKEYKKESEMKHEIVTNWS